MTLTQNLFSGFAKKITLAAITMVAALAFTFASTNEAQAQGFEISGGFGWIGQVNKGSDNHGFHFIITPGYRIVDWVGVYVDESFGGLWNTEVKEADGWFFGHTIVNAKFFLQLGPGELWGKIGIGGVYTSYDGHSDGAFGFKLGVGYTADLWGNLGIGGNFDYLLGAFDHWNGHYLDLQIHLRYKF